MKYEAVIGLEVHAQLLTKSKMFCSCAAEYVQGEPNTRTCPVCMGMPGTLPVINKKAVEFVIMTGLALNCSIAHETKFDRKNYCYPDLMKGYQISQYDQPIASKGTLAVVTDERERIIRINRVHLEEDVAKLQHNSANTDSGSSSLVDINRSGLPLMEIVGEPDIRSAEEARHYLIKLRSILRYLKVSTGNMDEGSMRCDANVSVRPEGSDELFTKVEVKNMNSFRAVYRAIEYETQRQVQSNEEHIPVVQETRGWVETSGTTVSQRSKEYAHDYRYFPEPDLPLLFIEKSWRENIRASLPELPEAKKSRFMKDYQLSEYDADLLTASPSNANFFEDVLRSDDTIRKKDRAKLASNWILGDVSRILNARHQDISETLLKPSHLSELLGLVDQGSINGTTAKTILQEVFDSGTSPQDIMVSKGLTQISTADVINSLVQEVLKENPAAVQDYLSGKAGALRFLVGQVMKKSKGKANPSMANDALVAKLGTNETEQA
jgi:aspartyl-tRNA(Asn)/glutamyl-tRNA(Gln) amidotransferase subunit B